MKTRKITAAPIIFIVAAMKPSASLAKVGITQIVRADVDHNSSSSSDGGMLAAYLNSFREWSRKIYSTRTKKQHRIYQTAEKKKTLIILTSEDGESSCLGSSPESNQKSSLSRSECSSLRNHRQIWEIDVAHSSGPFMLRNQSTGKCLVAIHGCTDLDLGNCYTDRALWYHNVEFLSSIRSHICPLEGKPLILSDGIEVCNSGSLILKMDLAQPF